MAARERASVSGMIESLHKQLLGLENRRFPQRQQQLLVEVAEKVSEATSGSAGRDPRPCGMVVMALRAEELSL